MKTRAALEVVAAGIVEGRTPGEIAARARVSERTLRRWRDDPELQLLVAEGHAQLHDQLAASLQAQTAEAVDTITDVMRHGPPATRLAAAKTILDQHARCEEDRDRPRRSMLEAGNEVLRAKLERDER